MKGLPHNLAAEDALLGACLLSHEAVIEVSGLTKPEHFYRPGNAHIFEAIATLATNGEPTDPVTVCEELDRNGMLDAVGGAGHVTGLMAQGATLSSVGKHARIIEGLALQRRLIATGGEIAALGYETTDATVALDDAQRMVFELASSRTHDQTEVPLRTALEAGLDRLEALYERGDTITGIPTGYCDVDDLLSGLQPGGLYVLGARPAIGKTAWALGAALHVALVARKPVQFFSLEMSQNELTQRIICQEARVDSMRVRNGKLTGGDWEKVSHATGRLADASLWIDDNPNATVMEIRAKARKRKVREGDLGLVVVDYLQLMTGRTSAENRQVEVAEISRGLKIMARELSVPVLALSQLNRSLEQRADKRPLLSDLRESGSLEQDADAVIFLYRDEVYDRDSKDQGIAEVHIAKHRQGATGMVRLAFLSHYTKFCTMARG